MDLSFGRGGIRHPFLLLLVLAVVVPGCGDGGETTPVSPKAAALDCTGGEIGRELNRKPVWEEGDRFVFSAIISKASSDPTESYEEETTGEFEVTAADSRGYDVRWVMEGGLALISGNVPPDEFRERLGNAPVLTDDFVLEFRTTPSGAFRKLLNLQELKGLGKDLVIAAVGEAETEPTAAEVRALSGFLTSNAVIYTKFIEKPLAMFSVYGKPIDTRKAVSSRGPSVLPFGGQPVRGVEIAEVSDLQTENRCTEIKITTTPDPDALRRAVAEAGAQLGTFDSSEVDEDTNLEVEATAQFDPADGTLRYLSFVKRVTSASEDITAEDEYIIAPD